jgi:hypothetical protein
MFGGSLIKFYKISDVQSLPISITTRHHVRLKYALFGSTAPSKHGCGVACGWGVKHLPWSSTVKVRRCMRSLTILYTAPLMCPVFTLLMGSKAIVLRNLNPLTPWSLMVILYNARCYSLVHSAYIYEFAWFLEYTAVISYTDWFANGVTPYSLCSTNSKLYLHLYCTLTLILLMWRIGWANSIPICIQ